MDGLQEPLAAGAPAPANPLLEAALSYARHGWRVFPLAPRSKLPLIGKRFGGRGVIDAVADEAQISRWWDIRPDANVGIACGGGLIVLDVDGEEGAASLAALEQQHGALPLTPLCHTGAGGSHYYFKARCRISNSASKVGKKLDIRGDGGYAVAAPSTHPNGRSYCWSVDAHPDEVVLAEMPEWLARLAGGERDNVVRLPQPAEFWSRVVRNGASEGSRNDTLARLTGFLLQRKVNALVVLDLMRCWNSQRCRPPLDDEEVARTVESIYEAELRKGDA
jgi:hypothetical protein